MSRPRVISGSAKGKRLNSVPGDVVRPITDRVKESLFNILRADLPGCAFLDLFGGTGSVGIEALSRGASYARFIERYKPAVRAIRENLALTNLGESGEVLQMDSFVYLEREPDRDFDYVFVAPPQYKELWQRAMLALDKKPEWLVSDGWIIVQIDPKEYEALALKNFSEFDQRKYGNTLLVFYEREI